MKRKSLFVLITLAAGSLLAADSGPKDDIIAAAKKLGQQSYNWKTTMEMGNFSNTSDGQVNKDGVVHLTMTFNENTTQAYLKGEKGAIKLPDQEWQSLAEVTSDSGGQGRGRFMGRMFRNYKAPAAQLEEVVAKTKELKKEGDALAADLTDAGAKDLLAFGGRRGANANAPETQERQRQPQGLAQGWPSSQVPAQGSGHHHHAQRR